MDDRKLKILANKVRKGIITSVHAAGSGHPGGAMSAADVFTYLYFEELNIDPKRPDWPDRDRFVLSKGHTVPGLYAAMALRGFFPAEDLTSLRKLGTYLQGSPVLDPEHGIDMSTGSLGQGLSAAVGMAVAAKIYGKTYRSYCMVGDGELEEGQIWEAAMFAGDKNLDNLCVIVDNNNLQVDGTLTEICTPEPIDRKFEDFHFHVVSGISAHDFGQLRAAFREARETKNAPTAIIVSSVKGKGVSFMEDVASWHGKAPNDEEYRIAMEELEKEGEALCRAK